jgi:hypothetical protein
MIGINKSILLKFEGSPAQIENDLNARISPLIKVRTDLREPTEAKPIFIQSFKAIPAFLIIRLSLLEIYGGLGNIFSWA